MDLGPTQSGSLGYRISMEPGSFDNIGYYQV